MTVFESLGVEGGADGCGVEHFRCNRDDVRTGDGKCCGHVIEDLINRCCLVASCAVEEAFDQAKAHAAKGAAIERSRVVLADGAERYQGCGVVVGIIANACHDGKSNSKVINIPSNGSNGILSERDRNDTRASYQTPSRSDTEQTVRTCRTAQRVDCVRTGAKHGKGCCNRCACASGAAAWGPSVVIGIDRLTAKR